MTLLDARGAMADRRSSTGPLRAGLVLLVCLASSSPYAGADIAISLVSTGVVLIALTVPPERVVLPRALPVLALGLLFLLSATWSAAPFSTLPAATAVLMMTAAVAATLRVLSREQFIGTVATGLLIVLGVSILTAAVVPSVGLVDESYQSGALKGLFVHRNLLAYVAVVTLLTVAVLRSTLSRLQFGAAATMAFACLLGARSQTALVSLLAVGAAALVVRALRHVTGFTRTLLAAVSTAAIGASVYLALFAFADIAQSLGRDSTLTGRTDVWPAVIQEIERQPFLGLGWNAAWQPESPSTNRMWRAAGFQMFHAHDGYLDVLLQAGVLGLVAFAGVLAVTLTRSTRDYVLRGERPAMWSFALAVSLVLANVTESPSTNFFGVFVLVCSALSANKLPSWGASRVRAAGGGPLAAVARGRSIAR